MTTSALTRTAPFLVWPVSRREFYRAIAIALLPTLAWAVILFGWRVLGMLLGATLAALLAHHLLKRFTTRGKRLVFPHSLVAAWVLVALAQPWWPIWIVSLAALLVPLALFLVGGPGRERFHTSILILLLLQFLLVPLLPPSPASDAILAKDRLIMGDIRDQTPIPLYQWPRSWEIRGNDAAALPRPSHLALHTLNELADRLAPNDLWNGNRPLPTTRILADSILNPALAQLPDMDLLILGIAPGRAGVVSLIGLIWGGLFLAYRYILRPRSVALFFIAFTLFSALLALWPALFASAHLSLAAIGRIWTAFPSEIITLLNYSLLNSDAPFAAIFILALPGAEPLTPRGRQVFLIVAALLAAIFTRANLPLPTASLALTLLMPLAPAFDRHFAKPSWLNRRL